MAGIGRLTASMASLHNENSAALISNNIDFTLVKVEYPLEYTGIGTTISHKRKIDAEEGGLHKTARRLGALFDGILPRTDELFRAYGTRVSEISSMPTVNPQQTGKSKGIFTAYTGVDTASIWAAVTSGSTAIAVHLLACMLSRMFTPPEAISLWVELIKKRKEYIREEHSSRLYSHEQNAAMEAMKQDISRTDLANWDASARAWLQSGDQAKAFQHKQTMLILNNASVPVNTEQQTYASVMKAWVSALEAMNNLVKGVPQRVQDGAALLAISSWHLYPDMAVYGVCCVEVKQKDPLFDPAALLTLGLQHVRKDSKSVYWSLPLTCLQYYGYPVQASRTAGQENTRVSSQEFGLSSLFRQMPKPSWLIHLQISAETLEDGEEWERKHQLVKLGRRRSALLGPLSSVTAPLFGLSKIEELLPALDDEHERVKMLRHLSSHLKLNSMDLLIKYSTTGKVPNIEYSSLIPVGRALGKRKRTGELKNDGSSAPEYVCWIPLSEDQLRVCNKRAKDFQDLPRDLSRAEMRLNELERQGRPSYIDRQTAYDEKRELEQLITICRRRLSIEGRGEACRPVTELVNPKQGNFDEKSLIFSLEEDFFKATADLLGRIETESRIQSAVSQTFLIGVPNLAAIYSISLKRATDAGTSIGRSPTLHIVMPLEFLVDALPKHRFNRDTLMTKLSKVGHTSLQEEIASLQAFAQMVEIYKLLPGATISTLVVGQLLCRAKWAIKDQQYPPSTELTLSRAFAFIAMFESGTCNLDPNSLSQVFAMSSGNSLFVAGAFLCDPYQNPAPTEIRRVIGNIGKAGITFLISPPEVNVREPNPENWIAINHNPFNGKLEDYFQQTSMHLSFTGYEIPLVAENNPRHLIDRAVVLVETLISVYDGGTWVAEVDILKSLRLHVYRVPCPAGNSEQTYCYHQIKETVQTPAREYIKVQSSNFQAFQAANARLVVTGVENWDELIEAPDTRIIAILAHKNWLARLAITAVCRRSNFIPLILPDDPCWLCCADLVQTAGNKLALIC